MAEVRGLAPAPGGVARCPTCDQVLVRLVRVPAGRQENGAPRAFPDEATSPPSFKQRQKEKPMEFLVEFEVNVPDGTPVSEVKDRESAEASAAAELVNEGHLVRVWNRPVAVGDTTVVGLYRADSQAHLDGLLGALPLYEWMHITVTPLQPHPNDPAGAAMRNQLPDPRLTQVYRLEAALGQPLELGDTAKGHRRIVPLTAGTFTGPAISGKLLPGTSADWQVVLP